MLGRKRSRAQAGFRPGSDGLSVRRHRRQTETGEEDHDEENVCRDVYPDGHPAVRRYGSGRRGEGQHPRRRRRGLHRGRRRALHGDLQLGPDRRGRVERQRRNSGSQDQARHGGRRHGPGPGRERGPQVRGGRPDVRGHRSPHEPHGPGHPQDLRHQRHGHHHHGRLQAGAHRAGVQPLLPRERAQRRPRSQLRPFHRGGAGGQEGGHPEREGGLHREPGQTDHQGPEGARGHGHHAGHHCGRG